MFIKNKTGFTLIELLVVIAIIGLLSTLAVVQINISRDKARDAKKLSETKQLSKLLGMYAANNPNTQIECVGVCATDSDASTINGPLGLSDFSKLEVGNYFIDIGAPPATAIGGNTVSTLIVYFNLEEGTHEVTAGCKQIDYEGNISEYNTDGDPNTCP